MSAIELSNVSKVYQKDFWAKRIPAVSNLSFIAKKNRVTGFVGPNGAGKTTTIKMIMGLVFPDTGSVKIYGKDSRLKEARKGVAFLSEQPYFYSHLKVSETLRFAAELLDLDKLVIKSEIDRVLALVNLTEKAGSRVKELSKGMQQRLNMAQALLGDPHTLILDEPMSGMDPPGRRLFRNLFSDLAQKGKTIFFSSHVLDDIEAVCDDVVVLSKGKLTFCGEIDEILDKGFLGTEINVSDLSPDDLLHLRSLNCEIRDLEKNSYQLFVPGKSDPGQIQNFLFSRSIKVDSISRRTMSLEDLLYGGSVESKDGRDNAEISASSELSELKT